MDDSLNSQSYNISCDHIKKLNEKYNDLNSQILKKQFDCIEPNTDINFMYSNVRYLNSLYLSKKTCIYQSTETDKLEWANNFNDNSSPLGYKDDKGIIKFNENTRRKII
jgi:hypothetical protein